jgi:hypothetical protein
VTRRGLARHALAGLSRPGPAAAILAAVFALLAARSITAPVDDPDVWWIAVAGRDMLATLQVPVRNGYSYTSPTHPWIMHELLFGVLYAVGLDAVGPAFFPLLSLALAAVAVVLALTTMQGRARHPASAALSLLLILVATRNALFAPRPSHASLVLPLGMTALALRPGWSGRRTAAAVLLEIVWANAHGSFPLGPVLLLAAAFDDWRRRDQPRGRLVAALLAGIATAINPYGLRLHGLVERYLWGGDQIAAIIRGHIVEFFPLWHGRDPFVNPFNATGLALVVALAATALWHRRNMARALLTLGLAALAAYQIRHVTLAVVLGVVWMHAEIDDDLYGEAAPTGPVRAPRLAALTVLPGLIVCAALWGRCQATRPADEWIDGDVGGADLARLVRVLPPGARVYAPFQSSGLLVWLGAPRAIRIFFDSRNDCYDPEVATAAFALESPTAGSAAGAALARYGTDLALVPVAHPLAAALSESHEWVQWRRQGRWIGFKAVKPPAIA